MKIKKLKKEHKKGILNLLENKFQTAYQKYPELPKKFTTGNELEGMVDWLLLNHSGYVAIEDDEVIAFIHNMFIDDLFYNRKGVYTAEWGHYFIKENEKVNLKLLEHTYNEMLQGGYEDHAISLVNNQTSLQMFLFDNSYGSRCMDANMLLDQKQAVDLKEYQVSQASLDDLEGLVPLLDEHHTYMNASPSLLGFHYEDSTQLLNKWLSDASTILWVLKDDEKIIGMMKTVKGKAGGCDVTYDDLTLGVETTQLDSQYRGKGLGLQLLNHVINYAIDHDFTRLAVDYESHNPTAQYFWPKYFTPTVRSLIRNIGKKSTSL